MSDNTAGGQGITIWGWEIRRAKKDKAQEKRPSIVPPIDEDGSGYATTASGSHFSQYLNIDGKEAKDNIQLIRQYRGVSMHPEVDDAIENISNEAISSNNEKCAVEINLDETDQSENIKNKITEEFDNIVHMMRFGDNGHDIFRRWYIDGRIYHHLVIEKGKEKNGIVEIRPIDSTKIRKMKEIKYKKDKDTQVKIVDKVIEYFIYQEKPGVANSGTRMTQDSISYVTSGLLDAHRKKIVSHLHKALKAINQLRMMEDSLVIYRLARAPERRIFYIDVGSLPRGKAEQYLKDMMSRYRNKIVYDAETGSIKDDRKHMSMLEDFWLPRREGGRGTEISTLPGGENLGQIDDIVYFQRRLYRSLNVPIGRLDDENSSPFGIGRPSEITRDELKFQKFIDRLRNRFSKLFLDILKKQLVLKQVIQEEEWDDFADKININFIRDTYFSELKESEILRERVQTLNLIDDYVGRYFSKDWVLKNVLRFNDEEIKNLQKEKDKEKSEDPEDVPISRLPPPVPALPEPVPEPAPKVEKIEEEISEKDRLELDILQEAMKYLKDS